MTAVPSMGEFIVVLAILACTVGPPLVGGLLVFVLWRRQKRKRQAAEGRREGGPAS